MSKTQGQQLQAIGCILITTVMLLDHFFFSIQDGFLLTAACLSAVLLIIGIQIVKRADARAEQAAHCDPRA